MLLDAAFPAPNLSLEVGLNKKNTLEITGILNPFSPNDDKRFKLWAVQPEWRYWFCSNFNGWFLGAHAHTGQYNVGNHKLPFGLFPTTQNHRYEGWMVGGGVSVGYQWAISKHWGLEMEVGGGYTHFNSDRFECAKCGSKEKSEKNGYWGPTKAAVSLVYMIK